MCQTHLPVSFLPECHCTLLSGEESEVWKKDLATLRSQDVLGFIWLLAPKSVLVAPPIWSLQI